MLFAAECSQAGRFLTRPSSGKKPRVRQGLGPDPEFDSQLGMHQAPRLCSSRLQPASPLRLSPKWRFFSRGTLFFSSGSLPVPGSLKAAPWI